MYDTPRCRESNWGHRFELDRPPQPGELEGHFARWAAHHGGKGVERAYLTFETLDPWPGRTLPTGLKLDPLTVLRFQGEPAAPTLGEGCRLRAFVDDADWVHLHSLARAVDPPEKEDEEGLRRYFDWYYDGLRARVERGEGAWWGIWEARSTTESDGPLLAAAGLFWKGEEARFQNVQTNPDHRKRGYCSALIRHAIGQWQPTHSGPVYIAVTTDTPIEHLYRRLGFEPCSYAYALSAKFNELVMRGE